MILHVYSSYHPQNKDTQRRMALAQRTWASQQWKEIPVSDNQVRTTHDRAGTVPFVKDLIAAGIQMKDTDNDILVFTNSDICVSKDCCLKITSALQGTNAIYCFRRDFARLDTPLPGPIIGKGNHYPGTDLFAFRIFWWNENEQYFPDMLLAREAWDAILRILIEHTNPNRECALPNLIYHEWHPSAWEQRENRKTLAGQLHNLALARQWMVQSGLNPATIGI